MTKVQLAIKKYKQEGDLAHEYQPLHNMVNEEDAIVDFTTNELSINLDHPLNIECQPSYDGTVNLIINDDINPPRIINTRFSKIEDNRYRVINRNQKEQTNLYKKNKIDQQTRLFRNINKIPKIELFNISTIGQLKGGNYTFYIKFADNDYNQTDVVAESGQVSIFKGYESKISSISGTIVDERTDKAVTLKIDNIDTTFSKIYVYYTRETCDQNGIRIVKAGMFEQPYDIKDAVSFITINGFEDEKELTPEEINIQYNVVSAVKTQAQVQNMLFFGNVQSPEVNVKDLQNISYFIEVTLKQRGESIGWVDPENYTTKEGDDITQSEYYNANNIYYNLGYWPDEIYRLGVVYILNDDTLTPVFNLRGHNFNSLNESNFSYVPYQSGTESEKSLYKYKDGTEYYEMNYLERDSFLSDSYLDNTFGVFKNSDVSVFDYENKYTKPLYYEISLHEDVIYALNKNKIKGFFFVRQKRIPTNLCQAYSIGIDPCSYTPTIPTESGYKTESFLNENMGLGGNLDSRLLSETTKQCSGLLCLDAMVNPQLQANFDGTEFILKPANDVYNPLERKVRHWYVTKGADISNKNIQVGTSLVYVDSETPVKFVNNLGYSTKAGVAEDVSQFAFFREKNIKEATQDILRGVFCPFIGTSTSLSDNTVYTIKVPNYSGALMKDYFNLRGKDTSPFYAISHRFELSEYSNPIECYRGDCYTNTVTIRFNRNFIDSEVPVNDTIIDSDTWKKNYKGYANMLSTAASEDSKDDKGSFLDINRADVNTVPLGMWVTYKCLSNYNLGLRSVDTSHADEYALMGSPRSFYPVSSMSVVSSQKIEESRLLNDGYSSTVGRKRNFIVSNVPYIKDMFDNRIMFSNVQRDDDFKNAYRIFQGLSFKDIDRQYGAIVKLIPYGVNLFCVFEHGLGIVPINEKALIQTNTNQSIHMYGAGVIQNQISLVSPDFGSIWQESILRTPVGIYGVDTYAKKIWRYSDKGLETISDMKVQRFLNENIKLYEADKYPTVALKNVKTHYNNYKGDVMFTFYNEKTNTTWNLCYNERMNKWITRYSWTPLYSENINNIFYSLDQDRAKILSIIYNNKHCTSGIRVLDEDNCWKITNYNNHVIHTDVKGWSLYSTFTYDIYKIETSYMSSSDEDLPIVIKDKTIIDRLFSVSTNEDIPTITCHYGNTSSYFGQTYGIPLPVYFRLYVKVTCYDSAKSNTFYDVVGITIKYLKEENHQLVENTSVTGYTKQKKDYLQNGFYVHGKAGIFNEIDYRDSSFENEILPTKWFDRQEPFEFEFVVNDQVGLHKIFDNLVIISNNVQPNQIEYEIIGDVYKFNKTGLFRSANFGEGEWDIRWNKPKILTPNEKRANNKSIDATTYQSSQEFDNCRVVWDDVLNQYSLITTQDCKNIEEYGRRLGNIHYKEDSWYITIEPMKYYEKYKIGNRSVDESTKTLAGGKYMQKKEARIRDKFAKIRVKYTGEDMVIITALRTILTPSYS